MVRFEGRVVRWRCVVVETRSVRSFERGGWEGCFGRRGFVGWSTVGMSGAVGVGGVRRADRLRSMLMRWVERMGPIIGSADWKADRSSVRRSSVSAGRGWMESWWRDVERYGVMLKMRSRRSGGRLNCELDRVGSDC